MNTVEDLREALSEEAKRMQPPAGLEARVLKQALRSSAAADPEHRDGRRRTVRSWVSQSVEAPRLATLVAALLALAIVLSLFFTAHVFRPKAVPGAHEHACQQYQVALGSVGAINCLIGPSDIRKPIALKPPFAMDCSAPSCGMQAPIFVSPSLGWMTAGYEGASPSSNLYQTLDGGSHWNAQVSWDGPGMSDLKVSRNGEEVLIVTGWGADGPGLFYTSDGGAHWTSFGFPNWCIGASALCRAELGRVSFLNPREGWALVEESALVGQLFHTMDSGAHWTLAAGVDALSEFNRYMLIHQGLKGQLVFQSSSEGWFVPDFGSVPINPLFVYRTTDGGVNWQLETIPTPPGGINLVSLRFFNDREGLLEFRRCPPCSPASQTYVSTTIDGGATWTSPNQIPREDSGGPGVGMDLLSMGGSDGVAFIDAIDWLEIGPAGLQRTSDAGKHWTVIKTTTVGCCWLDFVDVSHGWSIVSTEVSDGLLRTTDGGVSWVPVSWPSPAKDFYMP